MLPKYIGQFESFALSKMKFITFFVLFGATNLLSAMSFIKKTLPVNLNTVFRTKNTKEKKDYKHRDCKGPALPAIIEIPCESEIKWEEGEIPWELNDNTTDTGPDPDQLAFLFI